MRPEGTPDFHRPAGTVSFLRYAPGTLCRANFLPSLRDKKSVSIPPSSDFGGQAVFICG